MDRVGASFERTLQMIVDRLGAQPGADPDPDGRRRQLPGHHRRARTEGADFRRQAERSGRSGPIPPEFEDEAKRARLAAIEKIVEFDDVLLERFFAEEEIGVPELKAALRKATISGQLVPILNGQRAEEQRRAAAARRRGRLPAVADGRPANDGY